MYKTNRTNNDRRHRQKEREREGDSVMTLPQSPQSTQHTEITKNQFIITTTIIEKSIT